MGLCNRESTYVVTASVVVGDGLSGLGEGENGGGAILHETEAEVEDTEGEAFEVGGVCGSGEVGGLGGDNWEKQREDDEGRV
ncbi:MAG: hypothetical protein Q9175_005433 [Cornicularia normoerica]